MKKPHATRKQPHASPQRRRAGAGNRDRDNRIAGLIAANEAGGEIDDLAITAAAERDGVPIPNIWSALARLGWRLDDDGKYRRPGAPGRLPQVDTSPTAPDHICRLLVAIQGDPGLMRPGEVTSVAVIHQVGCPRPGGGACCCIPEIEARGPDGRVRTIDADGDVVATSRHH